MKKQIVFLLFTLVYTHTLKAQLYLNNLNGTAIKEQNYSDVKGTPYAFDDWSIGTVQTEKGIFNNISIKYSELDDQLFFKSKDDQTIQFADPVKGFTMSYTKDDKQFLTHYRNGYTNIPGSNNSAYFEILADGKYQLLKKTTKKVKQETTYGSTESNKSFMTTTRYYIVTPEKGILIKKDKKSILNTLGNKQTELEAYAKTNNIDFKSDEDLAKLIGYYNSL